MSRKVLIAGATSAIAMEVARLCAARGDSLFLIGRNEEALTGLCAELGERVAGSLAGDLNDFDLNEGRVQAAIKSLGGMDIALIAHGYLGDQLRSEREFDYARQVIQTNFLSAVSLLMPIVNYCEKAGTGHIGAITSVAGERGRPRNYTYGSSKGALTRYLEGVRSRLYGTRIRVCNIKLGPVDTPMTDGHDKHALFGEKRKVAQGIVRALESRRTVVYLPPVWRWIMLIVRWLPEPIFQRFRFLSGR